MAALLVTRRINMRLYYYVMSYILRMTTNMLIGRGVLAAGFGLLSRGLSVMMGPIGWIILSGWTAWDIAGPAYRVTVPAVLQIAFLRLKHSKSNLSNSIRMKAQDIMHPEDQKAISALKKIPLIDEICRATLEFAHESIYHGENLGMMVKVDMSYMPELYQDLKAIAITIGIKNPELFVYNDPIMNAFTFGETNPYICISSSLIEKMTHEERKAILAHECGHILCQHVLYSSVVETLKMIGENFGIIGYTLTGPVKLALQYWSRRSELSADRCAAVVIGERVFQASMLKLTLGLSDAGNDPYRLVRQAKEYHQHEKRDIWSVIQQNCRVAFYSHPQNVNRAYEIERWKNSYAYKNLRQSITANANKIKN